MKLTRADINQEDDSVIVTFTFTEIHTSDPGSLGVKRVFEEQYGLTNLAMPFTLRFDKMSDATGWITFINGMLS